MLKIGSKAPEFEATSTDNRTIRLSELRGRPVVLFFFPKAFTSGCTIEAKQFSDSYPVLQRLGAEIIGISVDKHETQCEFAASLGATYPMVGDPDRRINKLYGVMRPLLGFSKRVTFVLDREGVVQGVFAHEFMVGKHIEDVTSLLQKLDRERTRAQA